MNEHSTNRWLDRDEVVHAKTWRSRGPDMGLCGRARMAIWRFLPRKTPVTCLSCAARTYAK